MIIIIVTVTKVYSVYIKYCSEQGEKNGNIRLMSKFGLKDKGLLKLIVGVVNHVTITITMIEFFNCFCLIVKKFTAYFF
jgi:hypothetical protein